MTGPDRVDPELLEATVRSAGFLAIDARYEFMHATKLRELTEPLDAEKTATARGFLAGIEACRRVPAILKAESDPKRRRLQGRVKRG